MLHQVFITQEDHYFLSYRVSCFLTSYQVILVAAAPFSTAIFSISFHSSVRFTRASALITYYPLFKKAMIIIIEITMCLLDILEIT